MANTRTAEARFKSGGKILSSRTTGWLRHTVFAGAGPEFHSIFKNADELIQSVHHPSHLSAIPFEYHLLKGLGPLVALVQRDRRVDQRKPLLGERRRHLVFVGTYSIDNNNFCASVDSM